MEEIDRHTFFLKLAIEKQNDKLNNGAIEWIQHFIEQIKKEKAVAEKFIGHVYEFIKNEPVIENNGPLQKRIQDAAGYFLPLLIKMKEQLQQHPLVTEHKETAAVIDENLLELLVAFVKTIYGMQYCKEPFTVAGFLKHKLNLGIPRLHISAYAANKKQTAAAGMPNPELYYMLQMWRDKICAEQKQPIYMVANTSSLKEVCTYLPLTNEQLQLLSGFGKAKANKYGDEIISMVQAYCNLHGVESSIELKLASPKRQRKEPSEKNTDKIPSGILSLQYFKEGKTIDEIAKERNLASSTIEGHLTDFIKTGEVAIDSFADGSKVVTISKIINDNPDKKHNELKAILGDGFSYTEIKAVANHLLWLQNMLPY